MRRSLRVEGILALVIAGLVLIVGCGGPEPTESLPASPSPTPTTEEVFNSPVLPTPTLTPVTLESGKGGVRGSLVAYPSEWQGQTLFVWLAPFYSGERQDEGIFVLEPGFHPHAQIAPGGEFQVGNVSPGRYVIVIGPSPEEAVAIRENGQPHIFEILADQLLDIGPIHLP